MRRLIAFLIGLAAAIGAVLAVLMFRFRRNQQRAEEAWARFEPQRLDLEAVQRLTITPLIDARTTGAPLAGEPGVSYLVQADGTRILFDLGLNAGRSTPSLLQRNAEILDVDLEAVDAVVISHRHLDHVGGLKAQAAHSFVLPAARLAQGGVPVYVPEPLQHLSAEVRLVAGPQRIAPSVATIGPIPRALFLLGWTPEQALAVKVSGRGIVLVVGCGHQGVRRLVERAEALFDEPLYGLVGGLHLPVTGLAIQRVVGSDRPPWTPLSREDARATIDYLRDKGFERLALSPHDSCDWTLSAFSEVWGSGFEVVMVGRPIEFRGDGYKEAV